MLRIKAFFISFVFVLCALFTPQIFAHKLSKFGKCPVEDGFQYSYNFAEDTKSFVNVRKLKEISPLILSRIQEQLKARVGESFFKKLKFDSGTVDDFDDASPLKADDAERIDGYDFVFKFSDRNKGLKTFYFKVVADSKGKVIDELDLPDIAANAQKGNLIPCQHALAIAAKNGFLPEKSSIYFIYDWETSTFVWDIRNSQTVKPDNPILVLIGGAPYRKMFIDANTGRIIKIAEEMILV